MTQRRQLVEEIMANINAFKHRVHFKIMREGNQNRITYSQWCVLAIIEKNRSAGIKEIAKMLGISSSAATQLVDGLVENRYAVRKTNTTDRRSLHIELSKKGKKHIAKMKTKYVKSMERLFKALSDKELKIYNQLHKKILTSIT